MTLRERDIALRAAVADDARRVWEWRNEAAARAASFDSREIPFEDHARWFAQRMTDPAFRMLIGLDDAGTPFGYARFVRADDEAEISVAWAAGHRGRGLGTALIRGASRRIMAERWAHRIVARV